jgi:hypothetical protein
MQFISVHSDESSCRAEMNDHDDWIARMDKWKLIRA